MNLNLTLTEILAAMALALVLAAFITTPYSFENDKKRDSMLNFSFFAVLILVVGSMHYKKTRENLMDGFYNNKELLCKEESEKKTIISQVKGYSLQSDYFIYEQNILYIGGCILLEDANKTKE